MHAGWRGKVRAAEADEPAVPILWTGGCVCNGARHLGLASQPRVAAQVPSLGMHSRMLWSSEPPTTADLRSAPSRAPAVVRPTIPLGARVPTRASPPDVPIASPQLAPLPRFSLPVAAFLSSPGHRARSLPHCVLPLASISLPAPRGKCSPTAAQSAAQGHRDVGGSFPEPACRLRAPATKVRPSDHHAVRSAGPPVRCSSRWPPPSSVTKKLPSQPQVI